ncbi:MAG: hypothetical protein KC492_09425, partial [Myxococcales bacterium]|nr:hypothetical protein [Myxococcales bacterium]
PRGDQAPSDPAAWLRRQRDHLRLRDAAAETEAFLARLLARDPSVRASASEALSDPFVSESLQAQLAALEEKVGSAVVCSTCGDETLRESEAARCPSGDHVFCPECFTHSVEVQVKDQTAAAKEMVIHCSYCGTKTPFPDETIARHAPTAFGDYLRGRETALAAKLDQEKTAEYKVKLQQELEKLQSMSDLERRVTVARAHIETNILVTRCPHCGKAFDEWSACFAVTCSRDGNGPDIGCGTRFCGWCLTKCTAEDHHRHVSNCRHNLAGRGELFSDIKLFHESNKRRWRQALQDYFVQLGDPAVVAQLRQNPAYSDYQ